MSEERYLTFALGKGRLAKKTLELFEQIGITCEEMKDKDTRKLIFVNEEYKLRFFLAKGPDVPTYVEYGAADIGVVGKDTILEENRNVYEVLDLGFGKCRMCVCGPASARELLKHHERIRVASKYPNIAREYFYNKKHQTVDIIKLNGSVELGPLVELSDVIVDIVETGSTLRENGLEVLEEVCPLSARMIVNPVSMQMEEFYAKAKDAEYIIYNSTIDGELTTTGELCAKNQLFADFKAVKEGNVWCTGKNMFQETMGLGDMIRDMNAVFTGDTEGNFTYLHQLK